PGCRPLRPAKPTTWFRDDPSIFPSLEGYISILPDTHFFRKGLIKPGKRPQQHFVAQTTGGHHEPHLQDFDCRCDCLFDCLGSFSASLLKRLGDRQHAPNPLLSLWAAGSGPSPAEQWRSLCFRSQPIRQCELDRGPQAKRKE